MSDDQFWVSWSRWQIIWPVVEAAIAYCEGTNPDDHPLDKELRRAVGELTKQ